MSNININSTKDLERGIAIDKQSINRKRAEIADLKNRIRLLNGEIRGLKADKRYLKSQIKTAQKIEICDAALRDLNRGRKPAMV